MTSGCKYLQVTAEILLRWGTLWNPDRDLALNNFEAVADVKRRLLGMMGERVLDPCYHTEARQT